MFLLQAIIQKYNLILFVKEELRTAARLEISVQIETSTAMYNNAAFGQIQ